MIIMISGKQGSGKTTLAKSLAASLPRCGRTRFSKPLYEMHDAVLNILNRYTNGDRVLDKTLLQIIGTNWGREHVSDNIWVDCLKKEVSRMRSAKLSFIVIDDLRFKNEFFAEPALKIRLECDKEARKKRCSQWRDNDNHLSETDLDEFVDSFDIVISTDTNTKEETLKTVMEFINGKILQGLGT